MPDTRVESLKEVTQAADSKQDAGLVEASGTPALATGAEHQIARRARSSGGNFRSETLTEEF